MFSVFEVRGFDPTIKFESFDYNELSNHELAIQVVGYSTSEMVDSSPATAKKANLIIKTGSDKMPIVQPIWLDGLEVSVRSTKPIPSSTISADINDIISDTSETPALGTYSLVITKRGVSFNERATWTVSVEVLRDTTYASIFSSLSEKVNNLGLGVTLDEVALPDWSFDVDTDKLPDGVTISGADNLLGLKFYDDDDDSAQTLQYKDVKDLIQKGVADRGINDTYADGAALLYPTLFGSAKSAVFDDTDTVNVVCIRSKEPRMSGTHDEVVRQVIYLIVPSDDGVTVDLDGTGENESEYSIGNAIAKVLTESTAINGNGHTTTGFNGNDY